MKTIVKVLPYVIIVIIAFFYMKSCESEKIKDGLYNASQDTLKLSRNENGQQVGVISTLQATNSKQFLEMKSKDSTILKLQKLVKSDRHITSATIITNKTGNKVSGETEVSKGETVYSHDSILVYPEYKFSRKNRWEQIFVKSMKDSTFIDYTLFNEYEITQTLMSNHWWEKKTPVVKITNLNPHTETLELRSFEIVTKTHTGRNLTIGAALGLIGGYLLFH